MVSNAICTGTAIADRLARWQAITSPGAAPGFVFLVRCRETERRMPTMPPLLRANRQAWLDAVLARHAAMQERCRWLHDDAVPYLPLLTGTEIFAEALGCPVHVPAGDNPFALPCVTTAAEAARVVPATVAGSTLGWYLDFAAEARSRAGGDAILGMVDVQSPMDIAALVWEKERLFTALADEPEAVMGLAEVAFQTLTGFLDAWFARFGTTFVAHYPDYVMHGGLTLSEDEIGAVSPAAFRRFFQPHLAALSERYGGIGVHCCADARHQWDGLAALPGLRVLNLNRPPTRDGSYIRDAYRRFAGVCVQMHNGGEADAGLPIRRVIQVEVDTADEARAAADRLNALREGTP